MIRSLCGVLSLSISAALRAAPVLAQQPAPDPASQPVAVDIAAEPLVEALHDFAHQTGLQIAFSAEDIGPKLRSPRVSGVYAPERALAQLLEKSGLIYKYINSHTIAVRRAASQSAVGAHDEATGSAASGLAADEPPSGPPVLEEILVTAQKRSERLQDVPIPVTVLSAEKLADTNQVLLRDYYKSVPGLSLSPNINGSQMLSIRGITTGGFTTPTVGVTVDDVPYGASAGRGEGNYVPDLDPGDLARIEVLRGPQGTLYGANSMGGLVKYVTTDPSFSGYSGRVEAGTSSVYNGAEPGFNVRGSANLPVGEQFALRASAFTRQDPGYIDNPTLSLQGVNEAEAFGGRLSGLWQPLQELSVKLGALYQRTENHGISEVNTGVGLGDLQQSYLAGLGGLDRTVQAYSAIVSYRVGDVSLVSVTGYNINNSRAPRDYTPSLGSITQNGIAGSGFSGFGVRGTELDSYADLRKVSQESRASGNFLDGRLEWLLGGFYTHEDDLNKQIITVTDPTTGQVFGHEFDDTYPDEFREYAGFADVTWHITNRFDVQLGGRESETRVSESTYSTGPIDLVAFHQPSPVIQPEYVSSGNAFTYLLTPRLKLADNMMVYARLASGYRPGGPNPPLPGVVPLLPDKTQDYDLGIKADFLDHRISLDASVYYVNWKDIQLTINSPANITYGFNGSAAKSQGFELSSEVRPAQGLTISGWIAYDDAELTRDFPTGSAGTAYGVAGNRLPNTPQWSGNLSVQEDFPLRNGATGFVGAVASYVGDRTSVFTSTAARQDLPAYTQTDLRAGVEYDSWTFSLYANNVADVRGLLDGGLGYSQPNTWVYITPRIIGLSVSKVFR